MLKIGKLSLSSPVILAPMSGITDLPFRLISRRFGCELAFTEMIDARALSFKNIKTIKMLASNESDKPLGVQLLGADPEFILKAMDVMAEFKYEILDLNAACPVKKVTNRGSGASLLREPARLSEIIKVMVKNAAVPVTIKIRTGWDQSLVNCREIARRIEEAGANGIFIHGRTRDQGWSGKIDYETIREVKELVSVPIIASGDIWSAESIRKMFDATGCDGVAVARGALGNPWIFIESANCAPNRLNGKRPAPREICDTMVEHLNLCTDFYGEKRGIFKFRKHIGWYAKQLPKARALVSRLLQVSNKNELVSMMLTLAQVQTAGRSGGDTH